MLSEDTSNLENIIMEQLPTENTENSNTPSTIASKYNVSEKIVNDISSQLSNHIADQVAIIIQNKQESDTNNSSSSSSNMYTTSGEDSGITGSTDVNDIIDKVIESDQPFTINDQLIKNLEKIRKNSVRLSIYHNRRYYYCKNILFGMFRVPMICLSSLNAFFAVGLQNYVNQPSISMINAVISLACGILTGIELLFNLQKRMEIELDTYKRYYKLCIQIAQGIDLHENSKEGEDEYIMSTGLEALFVKVYQEYQSIIDAGNAVNLYDRVFIDEYENLINMDGNKRDTKALIAELNQTISVVSSFNKVLSCFQESKYDRIVKDHCKHDHYLKRRTHRSVSNINNQSGNEPLSFVPTNTNLRPSSPRKSIRGGGTPTSSNSMNSKVDISQSKVI